MSQLSTAPGSRPVDDSFHWRQRVVEAEKALKDEGSTRRTGFTGLGRGLLLLGAILPLGVSACTAAREDAGIETSTGVTPTDAAVVLSPNQDDVSVGESSRTVVAYGAEFDLPGDFESDGLESGWHKGFGGSSSPVVVVISDEMAEMREFGDTWGWEDTLPRADTDEFRPHAAGGTCVGDDDWPTGESLQEVVYQVPGADRSYSYYSLHWCSTGLRSRASAAKLPELITVIQQGSNLILVEVTVDSIADMDKIYPFFERMNIRISGP